MQDNENRDIVVAALKHAAPYIRMFKHKTFVLKAGGEIFRVRQIDACARRADRDPAPGRHSGRARAWRRTAVDRTRRKPGHDDRIHRGPARNRCEKSLEVAAMVLNGQINTRILAACRDLDLPAVGISGVDAGPDQGTQAPAGDRRRS